jgi:gluconokinase
MNESMSAVVVMGVAGCGKSSVAAGLAAEIDGFLIEGDAFHPEANVTKMRAGIPLGDDDRAGWLDQLAAELVRALAANQRPVLACSALKRKYRERLRQAVPGLGFVFLSLPRNVAAERVATRGGHYMPATLVDSQFADLESPVGEPQTFSADATLPVTDVCRAAAKWFRTANLKETTEIALPETLNP